MLLIVNFYIILNFLLSIIFGTACDSGFGGCGSCTNIVDDVMVEGNECDACEEGYFFGEEGDTCDSTLNFVSPRQDFN